MVAKDYHKTKGSAKAEVGEIDTSAPFQSVKDAVSLFGEGAFSGKKPAIKKPKPHSAERVLAKETQLHLSQKELNKLRDQLTNAESTKVQALVELEKAKRMVEDLTQKLKCLNESKEFSIMATEAAKHQAKHFEDVDLETARVEYITAVTELDTAKLELRKIREEYNASVEAKKLAVDKANEAEVSVEANIVKAGELAKEIVSLNESTQQVKLATTQAREEEAKIYADKDEQKQSYKYKIEDVKKEREKWRALDLDSLRTITIELEESKASLDKVVDEENALRSVVDTLKIEIGNVKNEHLGLKEREKETDCIAGNLHVKLRKAKSELEVALVEEAKLSGFSEEMIATIYQLSLECENAKREVEEAKHEAEELKKEAEAARIELEEAETKLKAVLNEAEEVKAAEARVVEQIKNLSDGPHGPRASTSGPNSQITISRVEFELLNRKVQECEKLAEMKVEAALSQVEAVKASEDEALEKLEAGRKEIEDMKAATQEALKKAEMAEAAKKAVEGELRRWREREQKKAVEAASRILLDTDKSFESSFPQNYQFQKHKLTVETQKLEKAKTSVTKKVLILPNLSGVFHKKKKKIEGGLSSSPSYLPGEKPVW